MRKELHDVHYGALTKALRNLGFQGQDKGWKKDPFHLKLDMKGRKVILELHIDKSVPPYAPHPQHIAIEEGKEIDEELKKLIEEYEFLKRKTIAEKIQRLTKEYELLKAR